MVVFPVGSGLKVALPISPRLGSEFEPPPALRGPVTCLWILEHAPGPDPVPEKILPDGRAELIFNLETPYRRLAAGADERQPRSFVVGQIRRYLEVVPVGRVSMIGVRFQPTTLHRILETSMSELTDATVPLADLGRRDLLELEERLSEGCNQVEPASRSKTHASMAKIRDPGTRRQRPPRDRRL